MKTKGLFFSALALVAALLLASGCGGKKVEPARQYAVEDFFRNPEKANFSLSPDGSFYAWMAPYRDMMNVFVREIGTENVTQLTFDTLRSVYGFFWANNDRILYIKDAGGDENMKLFGVNKDGTDLKALADFPKVRAEMIDDLPDIDEYVIIGLNKRDPRFFDPYRLDINTGELTMLAENPGNIVGWMTDHNGELRVGFAIVDGVNTSILYRDNEKAPFREILKTTFKETMSPQFFTFDNEKFYAVSNLGRDKTAAVIFNPETSQEDTILFENPDFDVDQLVYSRARKALLAARYTSWKRERYFFDSEFEAMMADLKSKLGDIEFGLVSNNKAEDKFMVLAHSDKIRGIYYLYDKVSGTLEKVADATPWLDPQEMATMNPVEYSSRDGLTIYGYLTLPKGYTMETAKKLPVIVNPHGGPWYRDQWGFNPEVQFLANRGYAVFQMNFRGSTGYGKKFWEASFKQWGKAMQDDITDGVNWLIEKGIADKDRIAIYGASYGGYATLAGITGTPDLYAAAVDYVGVANMFTFMKTIPPYWEPQLQMFYEMVGDPVRDSLMLREVSPVLNADKIKTPLFVAQGANDPRVNINESNQMVEALRNRGITVEYMVKEDEGHGFYNEKNQFDFYNAMEKFLAEHLKK
ncbi:MAG: S9 family peptidase [Bacteroidales bacterium]|nr:S9 family peptidase [Bacteroidales bacterium]